MTTIAQVVGDATEFVKAVDALVKTDVAHSIYDICAEFGVSVELAGAIDLLTGKIGQAHDGLAKVHQALVMADAASATLGLVPALISTLGEIAQDTGPQLAALGLDVSGFSQVGGMVGDALKQTGDVIDTAFEAADETLAYLGVSQFPALLVGLKTLATDAGTLKLPPTRRAIETTKQEGTDNA